MAENDGQEKTEQPTPKRLQDSRNKGQVARSRELNTMLVMMAGTAGLLLMGKSIIQDVATLISDSLTIEREVLFDDKQLWNSFFNTISDAILLLIPFLVLMVIVAFLAPLLLSGWTFSMQAISFKWDKLDPVKGMGKLFAWRGLLELLKALAKFSLVLVAVSILLWTQYEDFLILAREPFESGLAHAVSNIGWSFFILSLVLIVIAMVDVPFQLWDHSKQLRMTKQEVKDEGKETEGSPEVRGHIRRMQREISQQRMMEAVAEADVVVTNPTHYAVAIKYDQATMRAPIVVAKGADLIAQQIRNVGTINDVPIVSAPPLARSLYYSVKLNAEIPGGLYLAVAQLLAYVYQLNEIIGRYAKKPDVPDFPIPDELKRDK